MADEAKDPRITELEAEVARATLEKNLATLRKEAAEAQQAELVATLPKTTTKGVTGDVTTKDGAGYFAEILAYRTLKVASGQVAEATKGKTSEKTVVLTDQFDLAANDALWQLIDLKFSDFEKRFTWLLDTRYKPKDDGSFDLTTQQGGILALVALPAILGAAADIAAFFRVNRDLIGRLVTLSSRALLAEMAAAVRVNCKEVIIPGFHVGGQGLLYKRLGDLQGLRQRTAELRAKLQDQIKPNASEVDRQSADLKAAEQKLEKLRTDGAKLGDIKAQEDVVAKLKLRSPRSEERSHSGSVSRMKSIRWSWNSTPWKPRLRVDRPGKPFLRLRRWRRSISCDPSRILRRARKSYMSRS
ncbi:MAG: hypothetical protein ABJC13_17770 [Acidobacteriota bacterium]